MKRRAMLRVAGMVLALTLAACENDQDQVTPVDRVTSGGTDEVLMVSADPSEQLAFAPALLTARANQPIKIQFANPELLPHSLVLVRPDQVNSALSAGLANGGRVPETTAGVLAASKVLNKGEIEMLEVQGLEAGTYPYICTVPGHYEGGMKGTLTVNP